MYALDDLIRSGGTEASADALRAEIDGLRRRLAEAEAEREAALRERDLAATEVNHRLANSLQIVCNILTMHAAAERDPGAGERFRQAAVRVQTIASVHRWLQCAPAAPSGLDAGSYLAALGDDLGRALGVEGSKGIRTRVEPGLALPAERLGAIGVVIAELTTNALKHGGASVGIEVRRVSDGIEVTVADDGPGFPPGFEPRAARGLGMRLVAAHAAPGGGPRIDRDGPGGCVRVMLPA